jgi:hypothetical protein
LPVGENPSAPSFCCCCCHSSFSTIDGQLVFGNLFFSLSTPLHNWFHFITERFAGVAMATAGYVYNSQKDGQI